MKKENKCVHEYIHVKSTKLRRGGIFEAKVKELMVESRSKEES
jgi:hypothetical protein